MLVKSESCRNLVTVPRLLNSTRYIRSYHTLRVKANEEVTISKAKLKAFSRVFT